MDLTGTRRRLWRLLCSTLVFCFGVPVAVAQIDHTYSIVAIDRETGQLGVAVQTHTLAVGNRVVWARPGVGAVATQASTNPSYGPLGLQLMATGHSAAASLSQLLAKDSNAARRQVAMVDANGRAANHTGKRTIAETCAITGDGYSAQANLMEKGTVCSAMGRVFEREKGDLAARLMAALRAAQSEGGDIRGMQSAALLVVEGDADTPEWEGVLFDLRVDDSPEPLAKLADLVRMQRAVHTRARANTLLGKGQVEEALSVFKVAEDMVPESHESLFWNGVSLVSAGQEQAAIVRFKKAFRAFPRWREVVPRLQAIGLLPDDDALVARILNN